MIRSRARHILSTIVVTALSGALILTGDFAPAAVAAPAGLGGIGGDGSSRSPYQIASADDLRTVAAAINTDPGVYAGSNYRLTADIDFAGASFSGIDVFRGVFEGGGHVIRDIAYAPNASGSVRPRSLAMFRELHEATVRNVVLDGVTAENTSTGIGDWAAGIAVSAVRSKVTGNSVVRAKLHSPNGEKTGGLFAEMDGGVASNNRVDASIIAQKMAGGVASYSKNGVTISNNLISANLEVIADGQEGKRGIDAGFVATYPGNPSGDSLFTGNVAYAGSIRYKGKAEGFVGRIVGYTGYAGWSATENLANMAITISGAAVSGPGAKNEQGTDASPEQLSQQATYAALGWDFTHSWRFDEALGHPVPKFVYALQGEGTAEAPFEIAGEEDFEFLAAQLNSGKGLYTGKKHFVLSSDLNFSGRSPWVGIDKFEGVLEGAGHRIANLVYGASSGDKSLGLFRQLTDATVRNVVVDSVLADQGAGTQFVSAFAVRATRSTLTGNTVIGADLRGPNAEKVSGLVAELDGGTVSNNWVQVSAVALRMPGGLVAYSKNGASISNNLVEAKLTVVNKGGTRGDNAGFIISYPGSPGNNSSFRGNVAYDGSIEYGGTVDGFAGRIVGFTGIAGWVASNNIANAAISIGGKTVTGPGTQNQHGLDSSASALAQRATYEKLGWDFATSWRFDDTLGHPVPRYVIPGEVPNRVTTTFYGDGATGRAFTWYSSIASNTAVARVSTDSSFPDGPSTFDLAATSETSEFGENFYRATVSDLKPGQRYYYRLGDTSYGVWSTTGTFHTARGAGDFSFISLTDTQSQNLAEAQLSAETITQSLASVPEAEFVVHSGDLVERGRVEQDWSDLLDSSRDALMKTTLAPAAGNHDESTNAFVDHFTLEAPNGQDTTRGAYYSFDYNDAHFMVLNTNEDGFTNQAGAQAVSDAQVAWLRQDALAARAAGAKWLILSMHKGVYTTANHADDHDVMAMRRVLMPVIDEVDIDLVLQGHDHVMARTKVLAHDADGIEQASAVETTKYTEMLNGKRIEYSVDPDGTIFLLPNTAGAKHYEQKTADRVSKFDFERYLNLFDRTGSANSAWRETRNFAGISVTDQKLTVDIYDMRKEGSSPRVFESFGIDRSLSSVDAAISALPAPAELAVRDTAAVKSARAQVEALRPAQRDALSGLAALTAAEQRIRELAGLVSTDGTVVAWAKADASERQMVTVRNDTPSGFERVPVQLRINNTPAVGAETLALFGHDGAPLPYEVETWNVGSTSTVWVRAPEVPAKSAATLWAYFGGERTENDSTKVWEHDYALVEHFSQRFTSGETRMDSTGTASGTLVGPDLVTSESERGTSQAQFGESRVQYPGDIGGDFDSFSVSGIYSLTEADLAALRGNAPMVAKENATGDGRTTFWQGMVKNDNRLGTRMKGNSYEFGDSDISTRSAFPADGRAHLVTQVYDGMTYSVFIDGEEVHQQMVEYQTTLGDHRVRTTIGDYDTNDGKLFSPFRGTIDEVQIAGVAFSRDFEVFRYANYFGNAVVFGTRTSRDGEPISMIVGTPAPGTSVEAGLVEFSGTVSERVTLTAHLGGQEVFSQQVDAGVFSVNVPVDEQGEQQVVLRATASGRAAEPAAVSLKVSDTVAPAKPLVSDTAEAAQPGASEVTLTASPQTASRETVETTFFASPVLTLDASNTVVRSGSTTDRTPDALTPGSGSPTGTLLSTTVGTDANPYQIFQVTLTEQQAAEDRFSLQWTGTGDTRRVSAHVYDHTAQKWRIKDSGSDRAGGAVELQIEALRSEGALSSDRVLSLLVWRGLAQVPFGPEHVYENEPDAADYDWAFDHVPDSQLYTQKTPDLYVEQMRYVADRAKDRRTAMMIHAGDLVNREYLGHEYEWINAEAAMSQLDDAAVPYMVSWGNHDYSRVRNGRVMLPKWYPMSRFEKSLEGSPWTFGGSNNIDNYYYTAELSGAKILLLTVGYFSSESSNDPGLVWARNVIASHPEHSVIIASHQSVNSGQNRWANAHVTSQLVDPFSNVKLVLGGHIAGTGVASRTAADGAIVHGILTDYQSRPHGGQGYLKSLSVDAENGLLYANTYSTYLDKRTSDGAWRQPVSEDAVPGFHGSDTENFVIETDFGGTTVRTLATHSLSAIAGAPTQIGPSQMVVGEAPASVILTGFKPDIRYGWFAELRDGAGHVTRSTLSEFIVTAAAAPGAPRNVAASAGGTTVTVEWDAPEADGGSEITHYEVRLSNGATATVDAGIRTTSFAGLEPGMYSAVVVARNSAGVSQPSAESNRVEIAETPVDNPEGNAALTASGDFVAGGTLQIAGSGFAPDTAYQLELRPTGSSLVVTADADGAFVAPIVVPGDTPAGAYTVVAVRDGKDVAKIGVQLAAPNNETGSSGGSSGEQVNDSSVAGGNGLSGHLPRTGSDGVLLLQVGAMCGLLLTALGLFFWRRSRRGQHANPAA